MNIHLPAILRFTRGTRFWPIPTSCCHPLPAAARSSTSISRGTIRIPLHKWGYWPQVGVRKWMGTCGNPFKVSWHDLAWSSRVVANSDYAFFWTLAIGCTHQLTRQTDRDIRETTCWGNGPPSLAGSQVFAVFQTLMTCRRSEPQLFWLSLISDCEVLIRRGPVLKPWRFLRHSWWLQLLSPVQFQRPSRVHPESAVDSLAF